MQKEVLTMKQVATDARKALSEHLEKVDSHFMEDMFSAAESQAIMENCLQEWYVDSFLWFIGKAIIS